MDVHDTCENELNEVLAKHSLNRNIYQVSQIEKDGLYCVQLDVDDEALIDKHGCKRIGSFIIINNDGACCGASAIEIAVERYDLKPIA